MNNLFPITACLLALSVCHAATADCPKLGAKQCDEDGNVQICQDVAGGHYWTTQEYKCTANGEVTEAPVEACTENNRRCGDDGYEQICLPDGGTTTWFRMKPHVDCR